LRPPAKCLTAVLKKLKISSPVLPGGRGHSTAIRTRPERYCLHRFSGRSQEHFYKICGPTEWRSSRDIGKVDKFLKFRKQPGEIIGKLLRKTAKQQFGCGGKRWCMAGCPSPNICRFPVLLPSMLCRPGIPYSGRGATPGWEPLIYFKRPDNNSWDSNYETGVMRRKQANTSIGRF